MIAIFYIIIILCILAATVVYRIFVPKIKGAIGELRVAWQLTRLNYDEYKIFNDVLIRTSHGTSQIDHIVISIYGIFVIEVKNYRGWIHGHEKSEYWTQSIYKNKTKFRNPIKQNWAHIFALKEILSDFKILTYYPIIVFAGSAELKNINTITPVIYSNRVFKTIIELSEFPNVSIEQVNNIADTLTEGNIKDKKARKEHIYQVRNHAWEREHQEQSEVCPWCGGMLTARNGQYGTFIGCTNYPECKYTRSFEGDEDFI